MFTFPARHQILFRVIKLKRMRWGGGHAACMTEKRNAYKTVVGKSEEKNHLESGRIILKCILKKQNRGT